MHTWQMISLMAHHLESLERYVFAFPYIGLLPGDGYLFLYGINARQIGQQQAALVA
jgi:hypothetical protein